MYFACLFNSGAQLPCFKNGCAGIIRNLRNRFHMNLTEQVNNSLFHTFYNCVLLIRFFYNYSNSTLIFLSLCVFLLFVYIGIGEEIGSTRARFIEFIVN